MKPHIFFSKPTAKAAAAKGEPQAPVSPAAILTAADTAAGRTAQEAASLQFAILRAQLCGTDQASILRIFGVNDKYAAAVHEVHGR